MKAIFLLSVLVFVSEIVFAEEKVKIKFGKEIIHGTPQKFNLCNPVNYKGNKKIIDKHLKLQYRLMAFRKERNKILNRKGKLITKTNKIIRKIDNKLHHKLIKKYRPLIRIANNYVEKQNSLNSKFQNISIQASNAYIILLRTASQGQPSLYGLQTVNLYIEDFLKNYAPKSLRYEKIVEKLHNEIYNLYKEQDRINNLKRLPAHR